MQMQKAIIGKKVGMTQIFDESGKVIPVTVIEAGPCVVTQKKTTEKDGYNAVQLGFEDVKESKLTKPELGHLKKAEVALKKHLKEFRVEKAAEMNVGDEIKASVFAVGDKPVLWAPPLPPAVFSRAIMAQARWALSRSRLRTSTSSRSTTSST